MSAERESLENQFTELFAWEKRKRRERTVITVASVALTFSVAALPAHGLLGLDPLRWLMPMIFIAPLAPLFFYRRRWTRLDGTRALVDLDKALQFDERAVTAWDLSQRSVTNPAAELVFKQANVKLSTVDPRRLFPRRWDWQGYGALALLTLWFTLLWFDVDRPPIDDGRTAPPRSAAQRLREFSRELQEKAQSEGLRESFKAGQELEQLAKKNLAANSADEQFKKELAGAAKKLEAAGNSAAGKDNFSAGESQQSLQDLKAELAAARDLLNLPNGAQGSQELPQQWLDRLAAMPQLRKHLEGEQSGAPGLGQNQLKSMLDRLDRQVTGELDRRTLLEAQQFLEQMAKQGQGNKSQNNLEMAGRGEPEATDAGEREKNHSNLPGKEPGKKDGGAGGLPEFRGGAQTQVKGQLGMGDSDAVVFKGKPTPGKSVLGQQEVAANYRRQAEQELNSERVPEALKETIRNYFLSLGEGAR